MIYLLSNEFRSALKIGYADTMTGIKRRKTYFQIANVDKLQIVAVIDGTEREEHRLHRMFKRYHRRGEWFHDCEEIRSYFAQQPNFYEPVRAKEQRKRMNKEQRKLRRMQLEHERIIRSEMRDEEREKRRELREETRKELTQLRIAERTSKPRLPRTIEPMTSRVEKTIPRGAMVAIVERKSDCITRQEQQLASLLEQIMSLQVAEALAELVQEQKVVPQDQQETTPASTIDQNYTRPIPPT